jgi:hypothetical protein
MKKRSKHFSNLKNVTDKHHMLRSWTDFETNDVISERGTSKILSGMNS